MVGSTRPTGGNGSAATPQLPRSAEECARREEDWKRGLAEILFGRLRLIAGVTLGMLVVAGLVLLLAPRRWEASSAVLVRDKPRPIEAESLAEPRPRPLSLAKEDLVTELELLQSSEVLRRAIGAAAGALTPAQEAEFRRLKTGLGAQVAPSSNVIAVRLASRDAVWAERTLDRVLDEYVAFRSRAYHPQGQRGFLQEQAHRYRAELGELERQLAGLGGATTQSLPDQEAARNLELDSALQKRRQELTLELLAQEKALRPLDDALRSSDPQYFAFLASDGMNRIAARLLDLRAQRGELLLLYPASHEKVQSVDRTLAAADRDLRGEAGRIREARALDVESLRARIKHTESRIAALVQEHPGLQERALRVQQLRHAAEILKANHVTIARRAEEARINEALARESFSHDVSLLGRAASSSQLVFPRPLPTLGLGLAVGLLLGVALAFLFELGDHTVRRPRDVTPLGLPVLFSIPAR